MEEIRITAKRHNCLTMDEARLRHLFKNPRFSGTDEEWEELRQRRVSGTAHRDESGRPYYTVTCSYCSWVNEHGPGNGHRNCDGPVMSKWNSKKKRPRAGYRMYDCPGYTLKPTEQ